ncbi:uncharacterized protein LOC131018908 [Salvia miltiorrhiza]|uniref:uncharacterized protein LOC131018908 n=1 Tax=Salvia miltiorrhiza TaxID=226208 RepID=UPI0025AD3C27|nr:uncharacterized protein LOC131018908 [Salvia miltiorrhiza]
MGGSDNFSLFIHHGGEFREVQSFNAYAGGKKIGFHDLGVDKFGFFDLKDLVESLGYSGWAKLVYVEPKSYIYRVIKTDKEVMDMLGFLTDVNKVVSVFVEGGGGLGRVMLGQLTRVMLGQLIWEMLGKMIMEMMGKMMRLKRYDGGLTTDSEKEYLPSNAEESDDADDDDNREGLDDEEYVAVKSTRIAGSSSITRRETGPGPSSWVEDLLKKCNPINEEENKSDYKESGDEINSSESDGEGQPKQKKSKYDPKADDKDLDLKLGLRFEDGKQCKTALTSWAIANGWFIRFRRVSKDQCEAICKPPCLWRVYAFVVSKDKAFMIKSLKGEHTCKRATKNKLLSSKWIANKYLPVFRVKPNWDVSELRRDIADRFAVNVSRDRLHKARKHALNIVRGSVEEHYAYLRRYIAELKRVDGEGTFDVVVGSDGVFKGMYICHSALMKGFKESCRPLIGLDGCFLKTYLGGILMCAVGKDGNNQMFPIAWGVVSVENEVNWSWFVKHLVDDLEIGSGENYTFISDQQKGLMNAVSNYAPRAEHRNCARHIYMNWTKENKGATLKTIFWKAVRATTEQQYKKVFEEMKAESVGAYQSFIERDTSKFCKAFLSLNPCSDMVDNNISETFNGWILSARGKHLTHYLEEIRTTLMMRQMKKLHDMAVVSDRLCPMINKKLEKMKFQSRNMNTIPTLGDKFEVDDEGEKYVVNIPVRTCTCRVWDLTGIPCTHGLAVIKYLNDDASDFVHEYYTVSKYLQPYKYALEPLNGPLHWPQCEGSVIKPPTVKNMPGRPKKNRIRDPHEVDPKNPNRFKRKGLVMTCGNCGERGHNTRSCKKEKVEKPTKEK